MVTRIDTTDLVERLYRVEAPHFCAGLVVKNGRVVEVAPILKRAAMGIGFGDLVVLCEKKGWRLRLVLRPEEKRMDFREL